MPEGPEVRRYANLLDAALQGKPIVALTARTKAAKQWLLDNPGAFVGQNVAQVRSKGKNLVGTTDGGLFFYAHLMMWGRWELHQGERLAEALATIDRRERARIVVPDAVAILMSAPVFEVGSGDAWQENPYLRSLGPEILPYADQPPFDQAEFLHRLLRPEHSARAIGAMLLDQQVIAGIGNYLRAEILFHCRLNPFLLVGDLTADQLDCLCGAIVTMAQSALANGGATVPEPQRARMRDDISLVYAPNKEIGTRHWVFRRTNLPCLVCETPIRQQRQVTYADEEGERERIIYFCPCCQDTPVPAKKTTRKKVAA